MQIAICDDNQGLDYNAWLEVLLRNYVSRNRIGEFEITAYTSGFNLLESLSRVPFDFIFLDVDMPCLDGFETARRIRGLDLDVVIVFVTHLESQISMGYHYGAKDYLCKPVSQDQIDMLMDRLLEERRRKQNGRRYRVRLKGNNGETDLSLDEVLYFESMRHYIYAVMTTSEKLIFRSKLQVVADDLKESGFVLSHKSYLVNMRHIFAVTGKQVIFSSEFGDVAAPISKSQKGAVKEAFNRYRGW